MEIKEGYFPLRSMLSQLYDTFSSLRSTVAVSSNPLGDRYSNDAIGKLDNRFSDKEAWENG